MAIRILKGNPTKHVELNVPRSEGVLLLKYNSGAGACFHLIAPVSDEYEKLEKHLSDVSEIRYLGNPAFISEIVKRWPALQDLIAKQVRISSVTTVRYRASDHNVSFMAQETVRKKVLIVDDSKTIQKIISKVVKSSDFLEVAGLCDCPSEAKDFLEKAKRDGELPDLITLDIHMPEMNGVEFLKTYLKDFSIPVIMISSLSMKEGPLVLEALASGAETYIQKPSFDDLNRDIGELRRQIESIATTTKKLVIQSASKPLNTKRFTSFDGLVAIGSSTGGTQALQYIFERLPKEIPPIVVTQHIPAVFSKALADRLNTLCAFRVKEVEDGEQIVSNTIYLAPGGKQFKILKRGQMLRAEVNDDEPVNRFKPSVDYLFHSINNFAADINLVGVILTGMGRDGAQGLLELKERGAYTLAQDEESSVVFGMPKEAIKINAHNEIVSLNDMANKIVDSFNQCVKVTDKAS